MSNVVYEIRNLRTGAQYVGSTTNFRRRQIKHRHLLNKGEHHSPGLQEAWSSQQRSDFSFNVLLECESVEEVREVERALIECFAPSLYNVTTKPESWKRWRAAALTGMWQDPAYREKCCEAMRKPRQVLTCPHCGQDGGGGNMRRYHFDNCKARQEGRNRGATGRTAGG